jgi:hypothetical protein
VNTAKIVLMGLLLEMPQDKDIQQAIANIAAL